MKKEYPLRHNGITTIPEYRADMFCECGDLKDDHVNGFWSQKECKICKCPKYVRDKNKDGLYIECSPEQAEFSSHSLAKGTRYFRQILEESQ